jgi:hypothetical protein
VRELQAIARVVRANARDDLSGFEIAAIEIRIGQRVTSYRPGEGCRHVVA